MSVTMNLNLNLVNAFGDHLTQEREDGPEDMLLGHVVCRALGGTYPGDKRDELQKGDDWRLSMKLGKRGEKAVFAPGVVSNTEFEHIKDLVFKVFTTPMIGAQARALLGEDEPETE